MRKLIRKDDTNFESVDLNEIVRETVALVSGESRRRGITIEMDLADRLTRVHGDKILLQQVLINLFVNAMEAMSETAGAGEIVICTIPNGQDILVSVTDTGPGIAADQISHVFDHFFSIKQEGMGLGLTITRSLVRQHGGRIWAENVVGSGAAFRIILPAEAQPGAETPLPDKVIAS
jgi:signal transduction histidine kinase